MNSNHIIVVTEFSFKNIKGKFSYSYEDENEAREAFFKLVDFANIRKNSLFGEVSSIKMSKEGKELISFDNSLDINEYVDGIPLFPL
jgi:type I site-specific restriction-modification system R (restriction) subunit